MTLEKRIAQYGHMRSGNHYLRALINVNFLNRPVNVWGEKSRLLPRGTEIKHWPNQHETVDHSGVQAQLENPELLFVYIWRDFEAVAKSMIALGARAGIPAGTTLEEFRSTPWKEMTEACVAKGERWKIERQVPNDPTGRKENRSGYAGKMKHTAWKSKLTPEEYWNKHVDGWITTARQRTNIHVVKYEVLKMTLDTTLEGLSLFLGSKRSAFEDVTEKVSMHHVAE